MTAGHSLFLEKESKSKLLRDLHHILSQFLDGNVFLLFTTKMWELRTPFCGILMASDFIYSVQ